MKPTERTDPGVNQQKSKHKQNTESLGENVGSYSLQQEGNFLQDLFGHRIYATFMKKN